MQIRRWPANEPSESRDLELGSVVRSWADEQTDAVNLKFDGPLDAPGMDPTWMLELRGTAIEAVAHLFYGPIVDVTVVRLAEGELYVGGAQDFSNSHLVSMLDDLVEASHDGVIPTWLRAVPHVDTNTDGG
jgi:hypothetical protein